MAPAGRKFPVFWKFPVLPLPNPKSLDGSSAFPKWKRQPKSSSRRSRPAPAPGLESVFWLEDLRMAPSGGGVEVSAAASIVVPSEPIPWTAAAAGTSRPLFNTSRRETVFIFPSQQTPRARYARPLVIPQSFIRRSERRQYTATSGCTEDASGVQSGPYRMQPIGTVNCFPRDFTHSSQFVQNRQLTHRQSKGEPLVPIVAISDK